ncbi:DUF2306 domain-containing protein [Actinoplanes siamensis]|uniref:DUF2306 domain-containing protein n=1 Tax=Actinoplanes siamensis TaxID=1223317 RepID=A0A919NA51_9ACTN|nr:DUF2306 domain-containing protein [Actinoplanes siamensis]GIF07019.1 hypothetical protein Asi03nite_45570 [Actinoplanes siamensis]
MVQAQSTATASAPLRSSPLWQPLAVVLIAISTVWFLSFTLPLFIPRFFDPAIAPVRVLHGGFGILALITAVLQIWPGVRRRYPRFHRWNGRVYLFGGVLPGSLLLVAVLFALRNPANTADFFWSMVWLGTSAVAWRAARRREYMKHRQWMAYSVAITLVAVSNAALVVVAPHIAWLVSPAVVYDSLHWFPWVTHLAIAHWIVKHSSAVPYPARRRATEVPARLG